MDPMMRCAYTECATLENEEADTVCGGWNKQCRTANQYSNGDNLRNSNLFKECRKALSVVIFSRVLVFHFLRFVGE